MVADLYPGQWGSNISELTIYRDRLFFLADDGLSGGELAATFDVWVDRDAAGGRHGALRARSLDSGARLPVERSGDGLRVRLTLPAHEVDVLILDAAMPEP